MESIFENDINHCLKIVDVLYRSGTYISVDQLVNLLEINRKTLSTYVEMIDSISQKEGKLANRLIYYQKSKGYRFVGEKQDCDILRFAIIKSSVGYAILKTLFFCGELHLVKFCSKYYCTEKQVIRKVRLFNERISSAKLKIQSSKGIFQIKGEESQIRYLMYIIFWNLFKEIKWPYKDKLFQKAEKSVDRFLKVSRFVGINPTIRHQIICVTYINLRRINLGYTISKKSIPSYVTELGKELSKSIFKWRKATEELMEIKGLEVDYWLMACLTWSGFYRIPGLLPIIVSIHKRENTKVYQIFQFFLQYEKEKHSNFPRVKGSDPKSELIACFVANTIVSVYSGFNEMSTAGRNAAFFIEEAPLLLEEAYMFVDALAKNVDKSLIYEKYWLGSYYATILAADYGLYAFEKPMKIRLETDVLPIMQDVVANRMQSMLSTYGNVHCSPLVSADEADLILRTLSVKNNQIDPYQEKVIYIDLQLTRVERERVIQFVKKFYGN